MLQDHGTVDERSVRTESDWATYYVEFWTGDSWVDVHKVDSDSTLELIDWACSQAIARKSTHLKIALVAAEGQSGALHSYLCHEQRWETVPGGLTTIASPSPTPSALDQESA